MRLVLLWRVAASVAVLTLALGLLVGCGNDSSSDAETQDGEVMHMDDAVPDEGAEHVEGDEHAEGEGVAEANAHLEAAPKDALFLVEMSSFAYTPDVLEVNVGDVAEIAIQNVESVVHDFTIDEIDADVHVSYLAGTGEHVHAEPDQEGDVHFALTEPGTGVVHITVHEPGEYVFYCTVPGHREAGMEGTLVVREAGEDELTQEQSDEAAQGEDDGHEHAPGEEHD